VLLLDAGRELFLWVGPDVDALVLQELFGVDEVSDARPPLELRRCPASSWRFSAGQVDGGGGGGDPADAVELLPKLKRVVCELRRGLPTFAPLRVVVSGPNAIDEPRFQSLLVEDKTRHEMSYVDYLCAVHRKIQLKMV
jgi:protein transport protein SEC24